MKKLKVYVLDKKELIDKEDFEKLYKEVEITTKSKDQELLPEGYDIYSIHPDNTTYKAIIKLREKNTDCHIHIRTGSLHIPIMNKTSNEKVPLWMEEIYESIDTASTGSSYLEKIIIAKLSIIQRS